MSAQQSPGLHEGQGQTRSRQADEKNAPHAVHNDEDTVGISMNYVDASNVVRSIHWSPYDRVGVVNADP